MTGTTAQGYVDRVIRLLKEIPLEKLRYIGWEGAYERWAVAYPDRVNLNACLAIIGAITGEDWRRIGDDVRADAKAFVEALRGRA